MNEPTAPMRKEAEAIGKYKYPLINKVDDRIQIVTIAEVLAGKRIGLPTWRDDTIKSAKATSPTMPTLFDLPK